MRKPSLFWQLFPYYLLIYLLSLLTITFFATTVLRRFYYRQMEVGLTALAQLAENQIRERIDLADLPELNSLCREWGTIEKIRLTIILATGKVLGESEENPEKMKSHADRPEVEAALQGKIGRSQRFSSTLQKSMLYVAVPLRRGEEIAGVVRASVPTAAIDTTLSTINYRIAGGGFITVILVGFFSAWKARRITAPLKEVKQIAEQFAQGNLSRRLPVPPSEEMGHLVDAMNYMASQLELRIQELTHQRKEQEAILAGMVEGVLAVDTDEKIITMNQAAMKLFNIKSSAVAGRHFQEIIRNLDLLQFIMQVLAGNEPVGGDITIYENGGRYLKANGAVLHNARGERIGAVIVLDDVTRLRKLENLRREFVANVSHELKTPVTSIKGYVETLLDGAGEDPADARRFLEIIAKHTERLIAIIDDLLTLSSLEPDSGKNQIPLEATRMMDFIHSVLEYCGDKAQAKNIRIQCLGDESITAPINPPLLEQALINLIDNAVKFSDAGREIQIRVSETEAEVQIQVQDQGCGIDPEHLPRIFERFYRVDKARSRKLGGTGLGLAIVKHIAKTHGGRVAVNSTPGVGSIFTLFLPKSMPNENSID